jgi:hypothetical protein
LHPSWRLEKVNVSLDCRLVWWFRVS